LPITICDLSVRQCNTNTSNVRLWSCWIHCMRNYSVSRWSSTLMVAGTTKKRKWKWFLVNGCEWKSPMSNVDQVWNSCQYVDKCINVFSRLCWKM